jgi:hypothetical protein
VTEVNDQLDCDLEDGATGYDYNKGGYTIQLSPSDTSR